MADWDIDDVDMALLQQYASSPPDDDRIEDLPGRFAGLASSSDSGSERDENVTLESVATANTESILGAYEAAGTIQKFLYSSTHVSLHSSHVSDPDLLDFETDLDGVVVEMKKFSDIRVDAHRLHLPDGPHRVNKHWPWLKKHVDLRGVSKKVQGLWQNAYGVDIGTVDGGYHLNITLVPADKTGRLIELQEDKDPRGVAQEKISDIMRNFVVQLDDLETKDLERATVQANNLRGADKQGRITVKAGDTAFILDLIDRAIDNTTLPSGSKIMRTLILMGDKRAVALNLDGITPASNIDALSVHAAVSVRGKNDNLHLMWSRYGIQQVFPPRSGSTWTVMSMHEAANHQGIIGAEVCQKLRDVLAKPLREMPIQFVQLYCNSPHNHQVSAFFIAAFTMHLQNEWMTDRCV